jgi:hypothetical protein
MEVTSKTKGEAIVQKSMRFSSLLNANWSLSMSRMWISLPRQVYE